MGRGVGFGCWGATPGDTEGVIVRKTVRRMERREGVGIMMRGWWWEWWGGALLLCLTGKEGCDDALGRSIDRNSQEQ